MAQAAGQEWREGRDQLTLDLALSSLGVQTLWITFLHHTQRRIDVHFDKWNLCRVILVEFPREIPVRLVRRYKGSEGDTAGQGEEERNFAYPSNVFDPGCGVEPEVLASSVSEAPPRTQTLGPDIGVGIDDGFE